MNIMGTSQLFESAQETTAQTPEAIEGVQLPDSPPVSAADLAGDGVNKILDGYRKSVKEGVMSDQEAAVYYNTWDPENQVHPSYFRR
jgi:hypothetical protein